MPRLPSTGLGAERRHRASKLPPTVHAYRSGYDDGFGEGWKAGYKEGLRAGRRRAKGKPEYSKPHGGQKLLNDIWALQFLDFVELSIANNKTSIPAAAEAYLRGMANILKNEGLHNSPHFADRAFTMEPGKAREALIRLYRRIKNGTDKIDANNRKLFEQLKRLPSKA